MSEYTLSTGIKVNFSRLPPNINQDVVLATFGGMKFDKEGKLKDTSDTTENIKTATKVMKYHSTLITWGVELVGTISEYVEQGFVPKKWLKLLQQSEILDLSKYDFDDEDDIKFLFLRYYAFKSQDDWALLSSQVVGEAVQG